MPNLVAQKSSATSKKIERAALELFVEKGVAETTTRDIASRAGVAEGTIYRHFPSKEALAYNLYANNYASFAQTLERLQADQPDAFARLAAMIQEFCRLFDQDPAMFSYLLLAQHQEIRKLPDDFHSPVLVLTNVIANGLEKGEIISLSNDPDLARELASALVLGAVLQTATAHFYGRISCPMADLAPSLSAAAHRLLSAKP